MLELVSNRALDLPTRQAGALFFKNYIKRRWSDEDGPSTISQEDKYFVKSAIVTTMTSLPTSLQVQVGEAVTLIANTDFPARWENLIDDLVSHASATDMTITNGVLQTAHSIFKRWRAQFRSDELFTEIAFVLQRFCEPFLAIFKQTDIFIDQNQSNKAALDILMETMLLLSKVFYDLNSQDIPEFFEDHLPEFMSILHKYLKYSNSLYEKEDDDVAGPVEKVKASICEIIELYTQRYEEVFPMLPDFVNTTWTLLTQVTLEPKNDILVSRALSFLTCVVKIQRHAQLFESEEVLKQFIERIVLPNMSLRESDQELFEDDPIEFIRRDLEGSDSDTRRRSATEFVRGLVERFDQKVTTIVLTYIGHYLQQYNANPVQNWQAKDTAMYLMTSVAVKGAITKAGVSSTNLMIDVVQFFNDNVLLDLQAAFGERHPILKVDAIKYVHTFRNQLRKEQISGIFPLLAHHLSSDNYVVFTYSAVTVEALLSMKTDNKSVFSKQDVSTFSQALLQNLLQLIERGDSPEKLAENDFLMRCVMRIILSAQDTIAPQTPIIMEHLNKVLAEISKNPANPRFNHYLFESYGALIRYVGPLSPEALTQIEAMLVAPLLVLLQNDVTEFIPYVFQLLSQMLELHQHSALPQSYQQLLKPILTPALWDSRGNVPALVRLIQAFIKQGANLFVEDNLLEPVLGIFQKLIASKANDTYGFDLIESIYSYVPPAALAKYNQQIFILLLTRLNNARTEKFSLRLVVFIFFLSALESNAGPDFVISTLQTIQAG